MMRLLKYRSGLPGLALALALAACVSGCARRAAAPASEELAVDTFRASLFQGMLKNDMLRAAGRDATLRAKAIDDDLYVFEFRTTRDRRFPTFEHVHVRVERASETVIDWQ